MSLNLDISRLSIQEIYDILNLYNLKLVSDVEQDKRQALSLIYNILTNPTIYNKGITEPVADLIIASQVQVPSGTQYQESQIRNLNGSLLEQFARALGLTLETPNLIDRILRILRFKDLLMSNQTSLPNTSANQTFNEVHNKRDTKEYKDAQAIVIRMPIEITGARQGETLIGVQKAVKDVLIKNRGVLVPPYKKELDIIRKYPELWQTFMTKLGAIKFFANMSNQQRIEWLYANANDKDTYIHEIPGTEIQIIGVGLKQKRKTQNNKFYEKLTEAQINELLADPEKVWSTQEIYNIFPKKAGSRARRHVLIFNRYYWKVHLDYEEANNFTGLAIDLNNGRLLKNPNLNSDQKIIILKDIQDQTIGMIVDKESASLVNRPKLNNKEQIYNLILEYYPNQNINNINQIVNILSFMDNRPSAYKSLLQKIIRYKPKHINLNIKEDNNPYIVDAGFTLLITLGMLLLNSGSFVPTIQRFVSGLESATKRLAVTIFEDSYALQEDHYLLVSLLASSLLRQRVKTWKPNMDLIRKWFGLSLKAWQQPNYFNYDLNDIQRQYQPIKLNDQLTTLSLCSVLLDQIRSFQGDMLMVRQIAFSSGQTSIIPTQIQIPDIMPLGHSVDQHWAPSIAYYYKTDIVKNLITPGSKSFAGLFNKLFNEVTGINSRKVQLNQSSDFYKETRKAQNLILLALSQEKINIGLSQTSIAFSYKIEMPWIAGMIGPIEVPGNPAALVTLDPYNLNKLIPIRRPSRTVRDPKLSPERQEQAILSAKLLLNNGITMNKSPAPIQILNGAKLQLMSDNTYLIKTPSGDYRPEQLQNLSQNISYYEDNGLIQIFNLNYILQAIKYYTVGISSDSNNLFSRLLQETPINYIKRALIYISNYKENIKLNSISRDGSGTQLAVNLDDIGAFKFLCKLSLIYPLAIYKSAKSFIDFKVLFGPLLWVIRSSMSSYVLNSTQTSGQLEQGGWQNIYDRSGRVPEDHQSQSLNEMIVRHQNNKRGHLIWIKQGLGKTLIVMSYLKYLKDNNQLPKHVIYLLPDSAISSIIQEVRYFGFPVELLWPIQKPIPQEYNGIAKRGCQPTEYHISLIEHDKFKSDECMNYLSNIASNSILIVDEVHRTLNDTIRTSKALELSHLTQDFIAMSGTMIIDDKIYKLINWLEQIVSFEVNNKNFLVAANSMIAKRVNTGIEVRTQEIVGSFSQEEQIIYQTLVSPNLGGTNMAGTKVQEAIDLCIKVCTRTLIDIILAENQGVMVVARNNAHQDLIHNELIRRGIPATDIFLIKSGQSIRLTDEAVNNGEVRDYKVVITTVTRSLGYTLTRFNTMVSIVYPSNNADREQLEGRINRLGQHSTYVIYKTIHIGILTNILNRYDGIRSLSEIMNELAL